MPRTEDNEVHSSSLADIRSIHSSGEIIAVPEINPNNTSCRAKLRRLPRKVYIVVSSTFGLVIILVLYTFVGAAIFQIIEGGNEKARMHEINESRSVTVQLAWVYSQKAADKEEFVSLMTEALQRHEGELQNIFEKGVHLNTSTNVWTFWGSVFFCTTVYSTIGYGHISPATEVGKVATMTYALFGIPLWLIVMADMGRKQTKAIKFLWSFIRRKYYTGRCRKVRKSVPIQTLKEGLEIIGHRLRKEDGEISSTDDNSTDGSDEPRAEFEVDDDFNLPPIVAVTIAVVYILLGAWMYIQWEKTWSYLDAFYFIFISISTIGFGDVLPTHPNNFLASFCYIALGLALVAMVITVFMQVVKNTINKAKSRVINFGHRHGVNLSTEPLDTQRGDIDDTDTTYIEHEGKTHRTHTNSIPNGSYEAFGHAVSSSVPNYDTNSVASSTEDIVVHVSNATITEADDPNSSNLPTKNTAETEVLSGISQPGSTAVGVRAVNMSSGDECTHL